MGSPQETHNTTSSFASWRGPNLQGIFGAAPSQMLKRIIPTTHNPPLATDTPVHVEADKLELSWALSQPEQQHEQAARCQSYPTVGQQRTGHTAPTIGVAVKHLHVGNGKTGRGTD